MQHAGLLSGLVQLSGEQETLTVTARQTIGARLGEESISNNDAWVIPLN